MVNILSSRWRSIFLVAFLLLAGCVPWRAPTKNVTTSPEMVISPTSITNTKTKEPTPDVLLPNRLMIAYLNDGYLVFECLDVEDCTKKIALSEAISLIAPYRLGSVFFISPTSILVRLFSQSTNQNAVLAIEVDSGEVKEIILPGSASQDIIAHGRLVIHDPSNNTIYIVQEDLTIETVELETEIFQLIEADDEYVLALNHQPLSKNDKIFIEVIQINVRTADTTQVLVNCPPFFDPLRLPGGRSSEDRLAGWLLTISPDLEYVYLFYNNKIDDGDLIQTLGMFDTKSLEEVNSTKDPNFITFLNMTRLPSLQYRNWSYPRTAFTNTEGLSQGIHSPFDLYSLAPLVDIHEIIKKEYINAVTYVPFGNYFSIGTSTRVILVSLNGKVYKEYPLPLDRIQVTRLAPGYSIVEFHEH